MHTFKLSEQPCKASGINGKKYSQDSVLLGLDFETYCDLSLPEVGADRYFSHPSFLVDIAAISLVNVHSLGLVFNESIDSVNLQSQEHLSRELQHTLDQLLVGFGDAIAGVVAHNSEFERRCLAHLGLRFHPSVLHDSAVIVRAKGFSSSLAASSNQLLPASAAKLDTGKKLIKQFAMPNPQWKAGKNFRREDAGHAQVLQDRRDYRIYCERDAAAGPMVLLRALARTEAPISQNWLGSPFNAPVPRDAIGALWESLDGRSGTHGIPEIGKELFYGELTNRMNQRGWHVDMQLVERMQQLYFANNERLLAAFYEEHDPEEELNVNSPIQLQKWCAARGVKAKSFDKAAVPTLRAKVAARLEGMDGTEPRYQDYTQVLALLELKEELGGSALKKLQVIKDMTNPDDHQLRDQYIHLGAGQTYRTTGRGVQMQNLKRLGANMIEDMDEVYAPDADHSNSVLGENLRQVFTSRHIDGELIVGDFSSVESRMLAWLAGAEWKLQAFREGRDMYKVAAAGIFGVPYEEVTKEQRQVGKIAELSCGYGGADNAVDVFAKVYGVDFTPEALSALAPDWRASNPEIQDFWGTLDKMLHDAVRGKSTTALIGWNDALRLSIYPLAKTPESLFDINPLARSIAVTVHDRRTNSTILTRVFHGCHLGGRGEIRFYKPAERASGGGWANHFVDPKTKSKKYYTIYGGKLTGILTQSISREAFFAVMTRVERYLNTVPNAELIGQFHDELDIDWWPGESPRSRSLEDVRNNITTLMSTCPNYLPGFPLEADVKSAYRYIK